MNRDIYEAITGRFIEQLKRGDRAMAEALVRCPEHRLAQALPRNQCPASRLHRTSNPRSGSVLRQALDLGGHVKKGEKSTPVIYYKILEKRDEAGKKVVLREDGRPARVPFVRWANVFNLDQTEGIPAPTITAKPRTAPPQKTKGRLPSWKIKPGFVQSTTRDSPRSTRPRMMLSASRRPPPSTQEDYYHTLYHEMIHAGFH